MSTLKKYNPNTGQWEIAIVGKQGPPGIEASTSQPSTTNILWLDTDDPGDAVIPIGGATGQMLVKNSGSDYDIGWASPGLRLIKTATLTTQSNIEITNAFSSTYDNYRLLVRVTAFSGNPIFQIRMGTTAGTVYFSSVSGTDHTGASTSTNVNTGTQWNLLDCSQYGVNVGASLAIDIFGPQLAVKTTAHGTIFSSDGGGASNGVFGGSVNNSTQYTSFSLLTSTGTFDAVYYLYGYVQ